MVERARDCGFGVEIEIGVLIRLDCGGCLGCVY